MTRRDAARFEEREVGRDTRDADVACFAGVRFRGSRDTVGVTREIARTRFAEIADIRRVLPSHGSDGTQKGQQDDERGGVAGRSSRCVWFIVNIKRKN